MEHAISPDGTRIAYRRTGAGPPLVLVHGTTADHSRWDRIAPALEAHFTLLAMDRRGRGGSGDAGAYGIEREAEDIVAVVDAAGAPADVLAHSFGAICALEASTLTTRIRRLVLYEPPIPTGAGEMYPPGFPDRLQQAIDRGRSEDALLSFFGEVVHVPERELDVMRAQPLWQTRIALAATIPRELKHAEEYVLDAARYLRMDAPTLVLLGGDSPPMFAGAAEAVNAALPDARTALLPGQRHVAMDTAPALFVDEVMRFLAPSE